MNDQPKCPYCGETKQTGIGLIYWECGTNVTLINNGIHQSWPCLTRQRDQLVAENSKLKAEVERLKQLDSMKQNFAAQLAAKTAECEKLKEQVSTWIVSDKRFKELQDLHSKCDRLEKERDNALTKAGCEHWRADNNFDCCQQNAELCAALEKKDKALRMVREHEVLIGLPYESILLEALALKPDSTALGSYVKPLVKALKEIRDYVCLPSGMSLVSNRLVNDIARQALADWKARRQ